MFETAYRQRLAADLARWQTDGVITTAAGDAIRATAGAADVVVDLADAFGTPPRASLLSADGLHPTLAGHQTIARRFAERLAGSSQP